MPWFDPQPTQESVAWWANPGQGLTRHKVSRWPTRGVARSSSHFILPTTVDLNYTAMRYLLVYGGTNDPDDPIWPDGLRYGFLDLAPLTEGHLYGEAGISDEDIDMSLRLLYLTDLPTSGGAGVQATMRQWHPTRGEVVRTREYSATSIPWKYNTWIAEDPADTDETIADESWPWFPGYLVGAIPMSDCFDFPAIGAPAPIGFARFNGIDAWCEPTPNNFGFGGSFRWEGEFYVRDLTKLVTPMLNAIVPSNRSVVATSGFAHGSFIPWSGTIPPENVWSKWAMQRNWNGLADNRLRFELDDVEIANGVSTNVTVLFNRMGGNQPRPGGDYGDFDLRNFKVWRDVGSGPELRVDLPLADNGCGVPPTTLDLTTFNMDLPSCPGI